MHAYWVESTGNVLGRINNSRGIRMVQTCEYSNVFSRRERKLRRKSESDHAVLSHFKVCKQLRARFEP